MENVQPISAASAIGERVLTHLREEEQTLAVLLLAVGEIRQALFTRDGERLTQALQAEAESYQVGEAMRQRRTLFREEMAASLQIAPEEVTLSRIDSCVPDELRDEVSAGRQRLQDMSDELLRLNRQNAAMIQQTLQLTERIVNQLTGGGPHFTSYNANGHSEPAHVNSVLHWGG
jgi:flagellar biosynthesis/type III secretory pathway chaperone